MRVRGAVAGLVCCGLALTAVSSCSDDSSDGRRRSGGGPSAGASPSPSASATASGSASGSASAAAARPRAPVSPRATRGRAGQQRFARHVMAVWGYGLRTDDARPLTRLSPTAQPCEGCAGYARTLRTRKKQGWYVDFAGVTVRRLRNQKVDGTTSVVRATVDIPQSQSLNRDGTFRNTSRGHAGATFEVAMRWTGHRYRLLAFSIR